MRLSSALKCYRMIEQFIKSFSFNFSGDGSLLLQFSTQSAEEFAIEYFLLD